MTEQHHAHKDSPTVQSIRRSNLEDLRASEARYRRLFESAQDGILIVNAANAQVIDANPYIGELLGFLPAELTGKKLWELGVIRDVNALKSVFETLQRSGYARHDDLPLLSKDGRQVDVEFVSNRYLDGGQSVIQCNIRDISQRKYEHAELKRAATTDDLTGLANRRQVIKSVIDELQRARRYKRPLSLLTLDVDRFKYINDVYGHAVGDRVLRSLADVCRVVVRHADLAGRMGGDEFIVLLPETALQAAIDAAQRLRRSIEAVRLLPDRGDAPTMTVSIGVATTTDGQESLHELLSRADQQLYRAKAGGRNSVCADDAALKSDLPRVPAAAQVGGR
ncbi:MAG: sensor domain-containing diguanylate cyclase [Sinimarinibacterium sp.]|jgi:diguanylate cyclase (GGDEF)-like protein/PAS domain S-box-containing protein